MHTIPTALHMFISCGLFLSQYIHNMVGIQYTVKNEILDAEPLSFTPPLAALYPLGLLLMEGGIDCNPVPYVQRWR